MKFKKIVILFLVFSLVITVESALSASPLQPLSLYQSNCIFDERDVFFTTRYLSNPITCTWDAAKKDTQTRLLVYFVDPDVKYVSADCDFFPDTSIDKSQATKLKDISGSTLYDLTITGNTATFKIANNNNTEVDHGDDYPEQIYFTIGNKGFLSSHFWFTKYRNDQVICRFKVELKK